METIPSNMDFTLALFLWVIVLIAVCIAIHADLTKEESIKK